MRFEKSALARRCIDIYDMTQAVEDGATRPVYYESRVIKLHLDKDTLALIDATYDALEQQSDTATIEKSKKMLGQMESVLGADSTVQSLCEDIVTHYEKYRANLLTGKAMIVAYSRPIAMKIYRKLLELRPAWKEKIGVVMTSGNNDPEDWKAIIGTKSHKEELARKFKDNDDPMKIAIVVDMWLTGFDVPSLATMYIYKPMHGYNLMQAIARVNRVFKDKEGGLIVDYVGIASALKAAMKEYTKRDQSRYGDMDISKVAYPKFQEKLQVCKDLLHGFDFSSFIDGSPLVMAKLVTGGVNFVLDAKAPKRKDLFLREAMLLKQSHSLCSSMTTEQERHEAAYMEAVRSTVVKITYGGSGGKTLSLKEINTQINELLKASIQSQGVISLFDSKQADENISLFDPAVLDEISKMKEKNIAVEILKKLMAEQVSLYKRTNVVQSQKFSEKIAQLMNSYYNGLITNEEVIKELLKTAQEITELYNNGEKLGLTQEELADRSELSKGFISQLERNQNTPSIGTLLDIIQCLGTTPAEFFTDEEPEQIVFKNEDFFTKVNEDKHNIIEWVVPNAQKDSMEPVRLTLKAGGSSDIMQPHSGEEFGYLIKGTVKIYYGGKSHVLHAGESFYLKADKKHYIENPGSRDAVLIWVSTPPSF